MYGSLQSVSQALYKFTISERPTIKSVFSKFFLLDSIHKFLLTGWIVIYLSMISLGLFALHALFKKDSSATGFTNFTFVIVLAYSSACFSWARNITEQKEKFSTVSHIAEWFLYISIVFFVASVFGAITRSGGLQELPKIDIIEKAVKYIKTAPANLYYAGYILSGVQFFRISLLFLPPQPTKQ